MKYFFTLLVALPGCVPTITLPPPIAMPDAGGTQVGGALQGGFFFDEQDVYASAQAFAVHQRPGGLQLGGLAFAANESGGAGVFLRKGWQPGAWTIQPMLGLGYPYVQTGLGVSRPLDAVDVYGGLYAGASPFAFTSVAKSGVHIPREGWDVDVEVGMLLQLGYFSEIEGLGASATVGVSQKVGGEKQPPAPQEEAAEAPPTARP